MVRDMQMAQTIMEPLKMLLQQELGQMRSDVRDLHARQDQLQHEMQVQMTQVRRNSNQGAQSGGGRKFSVAG